MYRCNKELLTIILGALSSVSYDFRCKKFYSVQGAYFDTENRAVIFIFWMQNVRIKKLF